MRPGQIHNRDYLKKYRKDLRNNLTSAEASLWTSLKSSQLKGRKFRRQHSIENFIVDFYCPSEKLIVELDGNQHYHSVGANADFERDARLNELGFTIIRFENKMVFEQLEWVLAEIERSFGNP